MELDFLKNFTKRMKSVGTYAILFGNSMNKGTWKKYGVEEIYEQTNLIFATLLFIMEQSLKDEICTMDDIGSYIDLINMQWLKKPISYEECKELGDFIVNVVLCNEGRAMYFQGFDYEKGEYQQLHICFVGNRIAYVDDDVRRTTYYLTEDGYNMLLSTLEIEGNMKLTIHEMIFKLQLEKASYDKAVDSMKNIFNLLRIQFQKIQEAIRRIRQNALLYSVSEYGQILEENLSTIDETNHKFLHYREHIKGIISEMEERDIHIQKLELEDANNLKNLKIIEGYLGRALDEHQKILSFHFDLKDMYTKELEALTQVSLIKRFSFRNDFYDQVLKNPESLEELDYFFRPLFQQELEHTYNLGKALEYQKPIRKREEEEAEELISFDDEEWRREEKEKLRRKLMIYKESLNCLLRYVVQTEQINLKDLIRELKEEDWPRLLPTVEIFREIMIELLKNGSFEIESLQKEKQDHFQEEPKGFEINLMLLELVEEQEYLHYMQRLTVVRSEEGEIVEIDGVLDEQGERKKIRCSNLLFSIEGSKLWHTK